MNLFRPYEDVKTVPMEKIDSNFSSPINSTSTPQPLATPLIVQSSESTLLSPYMVPPNLYSHCQFLFPYQWYQRRLSRPLCGKYVRSGPAASRLTLLVLRQRILQRQQMKMFLHSLSVSQQTENETKVGAIYPNNLCQQFPVR